MANMSLSTSGRPPTAPDPWLAVNYAMIFPGLGQLYSRDWWKGGSRVAIAIASIIYCVWSIFGAHGNTLHGFWAAGWLVVLYSFSILDAYRGTQENYGQRITVPQGRKDVWYAVFLSQVLPGLGHLYIQQAILGGLWLLAGLLTAWLANQQPLLAPIPPAIWAFSCYHIYRQFPRRSHRHATAIALLILGLFITRLVLGNTPNWIDQNFIQSIVPSESMLPTLQVDDRLFVRPSPRYVPQRGDIVVFEPPEALRAMLPPASQENLFVKRIIGKPNETVAVKGGQVLIDGVALSETYVRSPPAYEWGPATVPPNQYFVLGDNRNDSGDSHVWGYLPAEKILGRAYKIYWPPDRIQPLPGGRSRS
jgi:signal peptidase I